MFYISKAYYREIIVTIDNMTYTVHYVRPGSMAYPFPQINMSLGDIGAPYTYSRKRLIQKAEWWQFRDGADRRTRWCTDELVTKIITHYEQLELDEVILE